MWLLFTVGIAAPSSTQAADHLSKQIGKKVPEKFVCSKAFLDDSLTSTVRVFGVKRKVRGCEPLAFAVDDDWTDTAKVLANASSWVRLERGQREALAERYVKSVLLAFDQPQRSGVSSKGTRVTVNAVFLRRTDSQRTSETVEAFWTFDDTGQLEKHEETVSARVERTLQILPHEFKGLTQNQVQESLSTVGRHLEGCYTLAWRRNHTLDERTRMSFTVVDGNATDLVARQAATPELAHCYAQAIGRATFPTDGTITLDLGVGRVDRTP